MKGVAFCDLESVIKFMYHGQVNVTNERLSSFLQTAEMLQIKGLTDVHNKDENDKFSDSIPSPASIQRTTNTAVSR